jgi:putative transposase
MRGYLSRRLSKEGIREAGLLLSAMRRLRPLEEQNGKIKKIAANLSLDKAILQHVILNRPLAY